MSLDDHTFKELVRARTDLVALIGESVSLQAVRGGQEFVGLCPFHDDHRPSMRVNPERQSFRCWSCATGGDCFQFVMLREAVTFPEAIELLANRARLEMPKRQWQPGQAGEDPVGKVKLYEVLAWAEKLLHDCLLHAPAAGPARDYLTGRGFTAETIAQFRLGYHPAESRWLLGQARGKFSGELLVAAKLLAESKQDSGLYGPFRDRVMFPIRDAQGRPVAFGGRVLPGSTDERKYVNCSESLVFVKSQTLFGLDVARSGIKDTDTAVVMEGYTDCILAHQCGVPNVVATLGTALTEGQARKLRGFGRKVVLVYDGDEAGQKATEKALPRLLKEELDLRVLTLPGTADPADMFLSHGGDWFRAQLAQAVEVWEYKLRCVVARYDVQSVDGAFRVLEEMLKVLQEVPAAEGGGPAGAWRMREDLLLGKLAQRLGLDERTVRQRLAELRQQHARNTAQNKDTPARRDNRETPPPSEQLQRLLRSPTRGEQFEGETLQILFSNPECVTSVRAAVDTAEFSHAHLRALLKLCYHLADQHEPPSYDNLMARLENPELKHLLAFLDEQARRKRIGPELLVHCLNYFRQRREGASHQGPAGPGTAEAWDQSHLDSKALLRRAAEANRKRVTRQ